MSYIILIGLALLTIGIWRMFRSGQSSEEKIRTILKTYKDLKARFPNKMEDEVCRSVLAMHLDLKYPIRNPDEIVKYISEVFPNSLDIDRVCSHLAFSMNMNNSDAKALIEEKERLSKEIEKLKAEIL